jgi:hypothetical protein
MAKSKTKKSPWSNIGILVSLGGLGASAASGVFALRRNNLGMLEIRDKVISADSTGVDIDKSLASLQKYVSEHMNSTPPKLGNQPALQLKSTYDRSVAVEKARVTAERDKVNADAISACEASLPTSLLSDRANCIIEYNTARPVSERTIVPDLYRYDFVSPKWTPDIAGWSIVIGVGFLVALLLQIIARFISRTILS